MSHYFEANRHLYLFNYSFTTHGICSKQQKKYTVSGSIVDNQNIAVPFANAAVYNTLDSALVAGAASDESGVFSVALVPGNYYLKISFLSYREEIIPKLNIVNKNIDLGNRERDGRGNDDGDNEGVNTDAPDDF